MDIMSVPTEILEAIISQVHDKRDLNSLVQTCRTLYKVGMIRLYEDLTLVHRHERRDERFNHSKLPKWLHHAMQIDSPHIIHFAARFQHRKAWVLDTFTKDYALSAALCCGSFRAANALFEIGADIIWMGDDDQLDTRDDELQAFIRASNAGNTSWDPRAFKPAIENAISATYSEGAAKLYDSEKLFWQEKKKTLSRVLQRLRFYALGRPVGNDLDSSDFARYQLALSKALDQAASLDMAHCIDMMEYFSESGARIDWENDPSRDQRGQSPLMSTLLAPSPNIFKAKMDFLLRHRVSVTIDSIVDNSKSETLGSVVVSHLSNETLELDYRASDPEYYLETTQLEYWKASYLDKMFALAPIRNDMTAQPNAAAALDSDDDSEHNETSIITRFLAETDDVSIHEPSDERASGCDGWLENFSLTYNIPREDDHRVYGNCRGYGERTACAMFESDILYWFQSAEAEVRFCLYQGITTELAKMKDEVLSQWQEYYLNVKAMRDDTEAYERGDKDSFKPDYGEWEFGCFFRSEGRDCAYKTLLPLLGYELSEQEISDLDYEAVWDFL